MKTDKAKHTPGPWIAKRVQRDVYVQAEYNGDGVNTPTGTFTICMLTDGFGWTGGRAETDATARLIAAAPDLLEACRLESALEDAGAEDADTRWKTAYKMRRAAIAKAEGGAR